MEMAFLKHQERTAKKGLLDSSVFVLLHMYSIILDLPSNDHLSTVTYYKV